MLMEDCRLSSFPFVLAGLFCQAYDVSALMISLLEQLEKAQLREILFLDHTGVCRRSDLDLGGRSNVKTGCESWCSEWSADCSYLAWSAGHGIIYLIPWNSKSQTRGNKCDGQNATSQRLHIIDCGEIVRAVSFGQFTNLCSKKFWKRGGDGDGFPVLAAGLQCGRIKLCNCITGELLLEFVDHRSTVNDLQFAKDSTNLSLVSASSDGTVKLWEVDQFADCNLYLTLRCSTKNVYGCRWSPCKRFVAAVGSDRMALLFHVDYRTVKERTPLTGHHHDVVQCDFSPDSALLATASFDSRVIIWDVFTQTALMSLGHLYPSPRLIFAGGSNDHSVFSVRFSPDGMRLVTVAEDSYVRVWQIAKSSDPDKIAFIEGSRSCSFSADGQLVVIGLNTGSLSILSTPADVDVLQHCCRRLIRTLVPTHQLQALPLPGRIKRFLAYREEVNGDTCDILEDHPWKHLLEYGTLSANWNRAA